MFGLGYVQYLLEGRVQPLLLDRAQRTSGNEGCHEDIVAVVRQLRACFDQLGETARHIGDLFLRLAPLHRACPEVRLEDVLQFPARQGPLSAQRLHALVVEDVGHVPADGFLEAAALSVLELRGVELCLGSHLTAFGARDQNRAQFLEGVRVELRIGRFRHQLVLGVEWKGDAARAEEIEQPVVVFHVRYRYGNVNGLHRLCVGEDLRLVQTGHLGLSGELALALLRRSGGPIPSKFFMGGGAGEDI